MCSFPQRPKLHRQTERGAPELVPNAVRGGEVRRQLRAGLGGRRQPARLPALHPERDRGPAETTVPSAAFASRGNLVCLSLHDKHS